MQLLVFSDSHGDSGRMREAILRHPAVAAVLHLGDGAREAADMAAAFPALPFYCVCGNCDMGCTLPYSRVEDFDGRRLFLTHGHLFHVKSGLVEYAAASRERGVTVALFGHTHQPLSTYADGPYLFNPGSIRDGRYGLVDISTAGVLPQNLRV